MQRSKAILGSLRYIVLICITVAVIFPILWMILTSLRDSRQAFMIPPRIIIWPLQIAPFIEAQRWIPFFLYLKNTLYVAVLGSVGLCLSSSFVAYGFSKIEWPGRNVLFNITLATMMLPYACYMIPLFLVWKRLGALGTFLPLWLPYWCGGAFSIFLVTQVFRGIPNDLIEAAQLDGYHEALIWLRIMIPLSRATLVLVLLFHFTATWREFYLPLIYLSNKNMYTLTYGLYQLQLGTIKAPYNVVMAASTLVALPMLLFLPFTQRAFNQDIATTGIKG
jgi:multiple sugar transport system permease protein